jgi:cytochrome c-type biogenesis protein CcmF
MNAELGSFALVLALVMALVQAVLPMWGARRGHAGWIAAARPAAWGQFIAIAFAYAVLTQAFVSHDFSLRTVAEHSNTLLPTAYRVAAVWGGHEGSMLLWTLMLAGWGLVAALAPEGHGERLRAQVLAVMGWLGAGFLLFVIVTSNPFERLAVVPADGRDLNPLLQDPAMMAHPPLLYMGYVGFSVVFARAIAALLEGRLDTRWARASRPWTAVAWCFLTLGIGLGSYWAYYELGWGGWWFWDPVENASLLPWLAGTALLHSLAVTEKRGSFKAWTVLLALLTFSLSLLGAFIVRSGVLSSVHAFATDPARGLWLLAFLATVVGASLMLFAGRAPVLRNGGRFEAVSRETSLLLNNVLLLVALASVLLGTLYPLLMEVLGGPALSVGPPYFDAVFGPLMAPLLFLVGIGPLARWRRSELPDLALRLRWSALIAAACAIVGPLLLGRLTVPMALGLGLAVWIAGATWVAVTERLRGLPWRQWPARLRQQGAGSWGMWAAHLGLAVTVAGITLVRGTELEADVQLQPGQRHTLGEYVFRFDGVRPHEGANYATARGTVTIERAGRTVAVLHPEKRLYVASGLVMSEAAIHARWHGDLYVALGQAAEAAEGDAPTATGAWSLRLHIKPFVGWIWGGALLMALGGFMAAADRRYRRREVVTASTPQAAARPPLLQEEG